MKPVSLTLLLLALFTADAAWAQVTRAVPAAAFLVNASYRAEPGFTPRERLMQATFFLGLGQVEPARVELKAALSEEPGNPDALLLLMQIDKDPVSLLGKKSAPYIVKPDETLLRIAEDFLGSQYLFYALARYNGLETPNSLKEGQRIRIPRTDVNKIRGKQSVQASITKLRQMMRQKKFAKSVTALERDLKNFPDDPHLRQFGANVYMEYGKLMHARKVFKKAVELLQRSQQLGGNNKETSRLIRSAENRMGVQRLTADVRRQLKQGQVDAAIETLESALGRHLSSGAIKALLVESYMQKADALLRRGGQEDASLEILLKAQKLDKELNGNSKTRLAIGKKVKHVKNLMEQNRLALADRFYEQGKRYLTTSADFKAYGAFKKASRHNPDHQQALAELKELGVMLSRKLHEKATAAFYQEEEDVDQAICLWDQVLKIDPGNRLARAERDRADLADCNVKKLFAEEALCGQRDCTPWIPVSLLADNGP